MKKRIESSTKRINWLERVEAFGLFLSILPFSASKVAEQERAESNKFAQEIRALELGKPIEREMKAGEIHTPRCNWTRKTIKLSCQHSRLVRD